MRVMAVAVHPDDETLGCGGALLKHAKEGASLHWLLITAAHPPEYSQAEIDAYERQVEKVREAYPFATFDWLRMPATRMEMISLNEIITQMQKSVVSVRPEIVYIPHSGDSHSDHRVVFDAALGVFKSFYMLMNGVRRVLSCEVISETNSAAPYANAPFVPNVFVDISETFERKLEIFSLYKTEVHANFGPRALSSVRGQARMRGATIGVEYAESFMLVREIL